MEHAASISLAHHAGAESTPGRRFGYGTGRTLRATTTMRAALPLKATNARVERAEERARTDALRAQIDELNAALVVANAEAERTLTQEQVRADRWSDRVDAVQRDLDAARADAVAAERRAEAADTDRRIAQARLEHAEVARDQAEQATAAERARADVLSEGNGMIQAGAKEVARLHAPEAARATEAIRQADDAHKAVGRWARLRRAWRGE